MMGRLTATVLLLSLAGCSQETPKPDSRQQAVTPPRIRPRVTMAPLMRDLQRVTEELGRRAGQVSMEGPAKRLALLAGRLPPGLSVARGDLEASAQELASATKASGKGAFNRLLDVCVRCHKVNAPHWTRQVETLRLP
jgi:hypothetical protein